VFALKLSADLTVYGRILAVSAPKDSVPEQAFAIYYALAAGLQHPALVIKRQRISKEGVGGRFPDAEALWKAVGEAKLEVDDVVQMDVGLIARYATERERQPTIIGHVPLEERFTKPIWFYQRMSSGECRIFDIWHFNSGRVVPISEVRPNISLWNDFTLEGALRRLGVNPGLLSSGPSPGAIFCIPLANGKFGAALVVESGSDFQFLVLNGYWDSRPVQEDVAGRSLMSMHPVSWGHPHQPFKGWFQGPFPDLFSICGHGSLSNYADALASNAMVFQSPGHFAEAFFERWRWEFDPEALVKEQELRRIAYESEERERRERRSLKAMLRERPFAHWSEMWPKSAVNEAHRIVRSATKRLIELHQMPDASKTEQLAVLKRVVDEFNELYDRTGCIETQEAGEVVDWVEQLALRVGLSNEDESLTGHRNW
jgi:hypothetical protein